MQEAAIPERQVKTCSETLAAVTRGTREPSRQLFEMSWNACLVGCQRASWPLEFETVISPPKNRSRRACSHDAAFRNIAIRHPTSGGDHYC